MGNWDEPQDWRDERDKAVGGTTEVSMGMVGIGYGLWAMGCGSFLGFGVSG